MWRVLFYAGARTKLKSRPGKNGVFLSGRRETPLGARVALSGHEAAELAALAAAWIDQENLAGRVGMNDLFWGHILCYDVLSLVLIMRLIACERAGAIG